MANEIDEADDGQYDNVTGDDHNVQQCHQRRVCSKWGSVLQGECVRLRVMSRGMSSGIRG